MAKSVPAFPALSEALNSHHGMILESRTGPLDGQPPWCVGFVDSPLALTAAMGMVMISALNRRGQLLLDPITRALASRPELEAPIRGPHMLTLSARRAAKDRKTDGSVGRHARRPGPFCVLRAICDLFASPKDPFLGLYGAFGYDLGLDFADIPLMKRRPVGHRDLVLYLPDRLLVQSPAYETAVEICYDFERTTGGCTSELPREGVLAPWLPYGSDNAPGVGASSRTESWDDKSAGRYAAMVRDAQSRFERGDLAEVAPSRLLRRPNSRAPSDLFKDLLTAEPVPYGVIANLGHGDHLVGGSPDMFVRVKDGTVLCDSAGKQRAESLAADQDALDVLAEQCWAASVTGRPKREAMAHLEAAESGPRGWYGGAFGVLRFDGSLESAVTTRTFRLRDGMAEIRIGALVDPQTDPEGSEAATDQKVAAFLRVLEGS
ncbi:MAG: chorismate-binding protein [Rhodospirillaceae bacterium]